MFIKTIFTDDVVNEPIEKKNTIFEKITIIVKMILDNYWKFGLVFLNAFTIFFILTFFGVIFGQYFEQQKGSLIILKFG